MKGISSLPYIGEVIRNLSIKQENGFARLSVKCLKHLSRYIASSWNLKKQLVGSFIYCKPSVEEIML